MLFTMCFMPLMFNNYPEVVVWVHSKNKLDYYIEGKKIYTQCNFFHFVFNFFSNIFTQQFEDALNFSDWNFLIDLIAVINSDAFNNSLL
jgi:hypothetical protein